MTVRVKNMKYVSELYLKIVPKFTSLVSICCLIFKPRDYALPRHRACPFSQAFTCVLYNGQMCIQLSMAEP